MKSFIVIVCLASLVTFFTKCSKNNDSGIFPSMSLKGTWELAKAQSGMIPLINYPSNNGSIIKFTDNNYQIFSNGQLEKSGTYQVITDTTVAANVCLVVEKDEYRRRIIYDNDTTSNKVFFEIEGNKLHTLSGCFAYDGGSYFQYVRREGSIDK